MRDERHRTLPVKITPHLDNVTTLARVRHAVHHSSPVHVQGHRSTAV
jgi:hypothetical protein